MSSSGRASGSAKLRAEQLAAANLRAALDHENEERAARPIRGPPHGLQPVILRRPAVEAMVGLRRSAIYKLMAAGEFPLPVKLTGKAVGWKRDDIEAWLAARPPSRRARLIPQERQASEAP